MLKLVDPLAYPRWVSIPFSQRDSLFTVHVSMIKVKVMSYNETHSKLVVSSAMYTRQDNIDAIIIGAGPSGVAMAHSLKHKLGFDNFAVRPQRSGRVSSALI